MDKDLIIVARPANGFRRGGIHHPAQQVRHPAGTFSPEEIAALKDEPQLVVIEVDPPPAIPAEGGIIDPPPAAPTEVESVDPPAPAKPAGKPPKAPPAA